LERLLVFTAEASVHIYFARSMKTSTIEMTEKADVMLATAQRIARNNGSAEKL
jgi:hypothetical protein